MSPRPHLSSCCRPWHGVPPSRRVSLPDGAFSSLIWSSLLLLAISEGFTLFSCKDSDCASLICIASQEKNVASALIMYLSMICLTVNFPVRNSRTISTRSSGSYRRINFLTRWVVLRPVLGSTSVTVERCTNSCIWQSFFASRICQLFSVQVIRGISRFMPLDLHLKSG